MAGNYGTIKEYQYVLVADTAIAITITAGAGNQLRCAITAPADRTTPVSFIFRAGGTDTPTTVALASNLTDGTLSPSMKPGYPCETNIPGDATQIVLESPEAGVVWVTIYEEVG